MNRLFDRQQIRRAFGRAAGNYEATAVLQQQVAERLLEQLEYLQGRTPERIVDVGAGTGRATVALRRRYRRARVVAVDLALPMLQQARARGSWLRPLHAVCADAQALPLSEASIDVLYSSLCLQWVEDIDAAFAEFRRVLRPEGMLLVSTFGPGTLRELRGAFAAADRQEHVSRFPSMQALGDALLRHGFRDPVLDQDTFTLTYPDVPTLMHELRAIGASNAMRARRRTLTGKDRMRSVFEAYEPLRRDGVLPSSWEVVYAHAWGPPPGQPRFDAGGVIASFPADRIPVRRRGG
ncbi:MAG TPA: malonyl-ACP O-methyltransferase BioC [Xanthomonadaceae bacterium]|nr:malonyl-ACP O-methyltransferase BioC [Xanthomonadaceae bacterium]